MNFRGYYEVLHCFCLFSMLCKLTVVKYITNEIARATE